MTCKAGMQERHRMSAKPPSNEEFKTKQLYNVPIEFIEKYTSKMYGIPKIRSLLVANPGSNLTHLITVSDLAYVISVSEDKKEMWEQQVELANMSPEERKCVKEDAGYKEAEPRFTSRKGVKKAYLDNAWNKEGKKYYNDLLRLWKEKSETKFFGTNCKCVVRCTKLTMK